MVRAASPPPHTSPAFTTALAIALGVFILDVVTPGEVAAQMLYAVCILVMVWADQERKIWWMATFCSGLTLLGYYIAPPKFDWRIAAFNRGAALALIWLTAVLCWQYHRTNARLRRLNRELEAHVEDRTRALSEAFEARERLNRDLHDYVLQTLYAIGLNLEGRRQEASDDAARHHDLMDQTLYRLKSVMSQIRGYIARTPVPREGLPFEQALPDLLRAMSMAQGPQLQLTMEDGFSTGLTPEQADSLLSIVREALSNCLRHSQASEGRVTACRRNGTWRVDIEDDGIGFDPRTPREAGRGLANMAARAVALGARFDLTAGPHRGVHITVALPTAHEREGQ
jgi:two-component system NarL family sensor kinase